jgi:phosphatidylglycerophosphatase A
VKRSPPPGTPWGLRLAATCFLIGEGAPFAPATFASLAVTPLGSLFLDLSPWLQGVIVALLLWIGILVSTRAERAYGHDAKAIVIDEVAGMAVTFLLIPPPDGAAARWVVLAAGFLLFRVFDVVKPFPAGRAQDLPGGTGVVLDDVAAGVYANLVLRVGLALWR